MRPLLLVSVALGALGCGLREEGLTVELSMQVTPTQSEAHLETATLAIERLELSACREARWWQHLSPVSVAWAHGGESASSPLSLAQPTLVQLANEGPQPLGTLHPPPGTYCALQVQFAPSSVEARSHGTTLLVEGTLDGAPLLKLSTRELKVELALDHEALDATRRTLALTLFLTPAAPTESTDDLLEDTLATLRAEAVRP